MVTLSVVMPIYKVEPYVSEAVRAVLDASYADLELILVDDGSPDDSLAIALEAAAEDPRVGSIRQDNRGVGGARNTGLHEATGRYVTFLDSDDVVEHDHFELAVKALDASGSDFALCSHRRLLPDGTVVPGRGPGASFGADRLGVTLDEVPHVVAAVSPWTKVYRRSFAEEIGLHYTEKSFCEDQVAAATTYARARTFDLLAHSAVQYRKRAEGDSIMDGRLEPSFITDLAAAFTEASHIYTEYGGAWLREQWMLRALAGLPFPAPEAVPDSGEYLRIVRDLIGILWRQLSPSAQAHAFGAPRRTALYLAAERGQEELAGYLMAGGALPETWRFTAPWDGGDLVGRLVAEEDGGFRFDVPLWTRRIDPQALPPLLTLDTVEARGGGLVVAGEYGVPSFPAPDLVVEPWFIRPGSRAPIVPTVSLGEQTEDGRRFEAHLSAEQLSALGAKPWTSLELTPRADVKASGYGRRAGIEAADGVETTCATVLGEVTARLVTDESGVLVSLTRAAS